MAEVDLRMIGIIGLLLETDEETRKGARWERFFLLLPAYLLLMD